VLDAGGDDRDHHRDGQRRGDREHRTAHHEQETAEGLDDAGDDLRS
jgi:hypothetical protein